ncbi:hypothetical protein [Streptomyces thinghirensis]|uniref:Resolvase/invertase-type recombinase catalytic domain-containing protein n=1 Tax=Streptomyces thinghirensis TaxID=551547 RepID=A0ABP9TG38_9ACTN
MAIARLAMFAQMEPIYMLERAASARAAKRARGLPTGRPAKFNATTRAGAAQRIKDGAIPEQVAADLVISGPRCTENYSNTATKPQSRTMYEKINRIATANWASTWHVR